MNSNAANLHKLLSQTQKRLKKAPEGSIQVQNRKSGVYFIHRSVDSDGSECISYIKKSDAKTISALTDKKYCLALEKVLKEEIYASDAGKIFDETLKFRVYDNLPEGLKAYVTPLCKSPEYICKEWQSEPFASNPYDFDIKSEMISIRGERVRSRAECIIADHLNSFGLAYRYEAAYYTIDGSTLYPDFTIMHPETNELYYLEYWGLMGDMDYVDHFVSKMNRYLKSGMGSHLISIFENDANPFDTKLLDAVIKEYFF